MTLGVAGTSERLVAGRATRLVAGPPEAAPKPRRGHDVVPRSGPPQAAWLQVAGGGLLKYHSRGLVE